MEWFYVWVVGFLISVIITDKRIVTEHLINEYIGPWPIKYPKFRYIACGLWFVTFPLIALVRLTWFIVFKFIEEDDDEDHHLGI